MRWHDIVSGILLILSTINFTLAAPVLMQRQVGVDVVKIPKDVISVLGKRGFEELDKLAEEFEKTWGKPIGSSDSHASSSSATPGPDHGSTNVVESPGPNPASSTPNPGLLVEPSSPSSVQGELGNPLTEDQWSNKGDDGSEASGPLFTPGSSEYGSDHELTRVHAPGRNPNPGPLTNPNDDFPWDYWMSLEDPISPRPAPPKEFGHAPEYQKGYVQQPNPGASTGQDDFPWEYWMSLDDPLAPSLRPASQKLVPAPESQQHVQQPNVGPPNLESSNTQLPTETDSDRNLMAVHQPPPYPLSPIGIDKGHYVNPPPSPDTPSPTEFYSYSYPKSVVHPPSPDAQLPTEVYSYSHPESVVRPSAPDAQLPTEVYSYSHPESVVHPSSPDAQLPTDLYLYTHPESAVHPQSPGAGSSTESEHEVASLNLGSPTESDNEEVLHGPPPTPVTDPELLSDHQLSSAASQAELQAASYAAKGKAKE